MDESIRWQRWQAYTDYLHIRERRLMEGSRPLLAAMFGCIGLALLTLFAPVMASSGRTTLAMVLLCFVPVLGMAGWRLASNGGLAPQNDPDADILPDFAFDPAEKAILRATQEQARRQARVLRVVYIAVSALALALAVILARPIQRDAPPVPADGGAAQTDAPTREALDHLTQAIDRLTAAMPKTAAPPAPAPAPAGSGTSPSAPGPNEDARHPFEATVKPGGTGSVVTALVCAAIGGIGLLFALLWPGSTTVKTVIASSSLAVAISGALPLAFKGEINLKGNFSCGPGGCLRFEGTAPAVLSRQTSTPSFDIGSAQAAATTRGCVAPAHGNDEAAWTAWTSELKRRWLGRAHATEHDMILLSGSADREPLSDRLRAQFESNAGLALARAEHVAARLIRELGSDEIAPRDRLDARRILVLAAGPAGTAATPSAPSGTPACDDEHRADQRRVGVWIQSARR